MGRSEELSGSSGLSYRFCPVGSSICVVAAASLWSAGLSLHFCGFAARRGRKGERRATSMPAQTPPLRLRGRGGPVSS